MSQALDTTWAQQRRWSRVGNAAKADYGSWQSVVLGLTVAAAVFETLSSQLPGTWLAQGLAGAGALAMAVVPVLRRQKLAPEDLERWVGARSASEELKAEIYQYLVRCGEYAQGNPEETLVKRRDEVLKGVDVSLIANVEPDSESVPEIDGIDGYLTDRVDDQIGYYGSAAGREQKIVQRGRRWQFWLSVIAALLGAGVALIDTAVSAAWVAVVTTVAASLAAHVAAGRHEHLVISYESNRNRLQSLRDRWDAGGFTDPCDFVARCEAAISSQNDGWIAQYMSKNATDAG